MYQLKSLEDTIAAIATPAGIGGIGIVRLSGKEAIAVAGCIFRAKDGREISQYKSHTVHYGWVVATDGARIDEALLTVMHGPKSYTAQDLVELSCHGGTVAVRAVLDAAMSAGARLAEPGEFTKRAFLNGRIDLTQAEAVLDLIHAKTEAFLRVSTHQLAGELSRELAVVRQELLHAYTVLEAFINFPEDDIDAQTHDDIHQRLNKQKERLESLLAGSENGRLLKEGIRVVLCGKPNVGKSSLLNILLKQDRAIVTDIAGTTRDALEETAQIKGVPFQLVDTAGILEPRDLVEQEAVKRSRLFMEAADLVLLVLDNSRPLEDQDRILLEQLKDRPVVTILNKCDLPALLDLTGVHCAHAVKVSATHKTGIEDLEQMIFDRVWQGPQADTGGILVSNLRHVQAIRQSAMDIEAAAVLMDDGLSMEFISEHIKTAVNHLDAVTGRNIDQDLLERIFSEFCIGK